MSDTIGRVTVPVPPDAGTTFPLTPDFGYGMMRTWPVITHRFGDLATKATQRFQVGVGPRKFSFRKQVLSIRDRETLTDFFESVQGSYKSFTYNAPNLDRLTVTPYTVIFEAQPLSVDDLANRCQVGINFMEIPDPASAPSYSVSSTCTRFPSSGLQTALLDQVQQIIPLVHIKVCDPAVPDIYLSDRRCTVGGQLYLPRLLELGEQGSNVILTQDIKGTADDVQFSFGNADRVMTAVANDADLKFATIDLSLYHANSGILLQLWKGFIQSYQSDGTPVFQVRASDGLYQVNLQYPNRVVSRSCWKTFNDGFNCPYATKGSGGDPTSCDYFFDSSNGCQSHGMDAYFGGHPVQPDVVRVKDNSTGVWGFGRNVVSATSIISDSVWGQALPEIWCNDGGDPRRAMNVKALMVAGRDESDFFDGLGIVGAGPIGAYTKAYLVSNADGYRYFVVATLDGQQGFGFNLAQFLGGTPPALVFGDGDAIEIKDLSGSLRAEIGNDPGGLGGWQEETQTFVPGGGFSTLDEAFGLGAGNPPQWSAARAAGTAFVELRRTDPSGIQPSLTDEHDMEVFISKGLVGWVWDASGTRTAKSGITNPFWIAVNSYLRAIGLFAADNATQLATFVLSSLIDGAGNGCAEIADLQVAPLFGTGTETQFQFQGLLAQQKPFRDWLTEIINCGLGYYTWEFGKLKLGIRENASAVEAFTLANMLFQSLVLTDIQASFEKLVMDFADQNYAFQTNTAEYVDKDHARFYGRPDSPLTSKFHSVGVPSTSQGGRIVATRVREEIGGVSQNEWKAARNAIWQSTLLAVNCAVGEVVEIEHPDCPGGLIKVRIQTMRFRKDWSIEFQGKTVTNSMYDLDMGPKPADVVPLPLPAVFFPIPQGQWAPWQVKANVLDAVYPGEWTFDLFQSYTTLADGAVLATLTAQGKLPVTATIPGCGAPVIHRGSVTQSSTGGFIKGGKIYRISVCALDATGNASPASEPLYVATTPDTDSHQFTISGILWPPFPGLTGYVVFASDVDDLICAQATGTLVDTGGTVYSPGDITVSAGYDGGPFVRSTWGIPNPDLKLVRIKAKHLVHGGVLGLPVDAFIGSRGIVAGQSVDVSGVDNWTGRKLMFIGRGGNRQGTQVLGSRQDRLIHTRSSRGLQQGNSPFASFSITAFNASTGTFTVDRDLTGIQTGDVFVVCTQGVDNSANPRVISDPGLSNAANYDLATLTSTPHSGLTPNLEIGNLIRVIAGTSRGLTAKVVANGPTSYTVDQDLPIDETSIWIVESRTWEYSVDSSPVANADLLNAVQIAVPSSNFLGQSMLVAAFTVNKDGTESGEEDAPFRMVYLYGAGMNVVLVTADTTLGAYDQQLNIDPTAGPITITLPPSLLMKGRRVLSKITTDSANQVTVKAAVVNGVQETLDFDSSVTLSGKGSVVEIAGNTAAATSNQPNWIILSAGGAISSGTGSGGGSGALIVREVPQGTLDGSNTVFTLSYAPSPPWSLMLRVNGDAQDPYHPAGAPQFTLDGNTITFAVAPKSTDWLFCHYFRGVPSGGSSNGKARFFGPGSSTVTGGPGTASTSGYFGPMACGLGFTSDSEPADGDTITIGANTYTFKTTINNAVPNEILTRDPSSPVIWNIIVAINGNQGGSGTQFSSPTVANPDVKASDDGEGASIIVMARIPTGPGTIALSTTGGSTAFAVSLISDGAMADGDTITIGSITYTFRDVINNATPYEIMALPFNPGSFAPGGFDPFVDGVTTIYRAVAEAVNGGFGSGTLYSSATTPNPDVTATYNDYTNQLTLTAKTGGAVSVTLGQSTGGRFTWDGSSLGSGTGSTPGTGSDSDLLDWGPTSGAPFRVTGDLSIGMWIKLSSDAQGCLIKSGVGGGLNGNTAWPYFMSVKGSSGNWTIVVGHDTAVFNINNVGSPFPAAIPNDTWTYIGLSRDTVAKTYTLYVGFGDGLTPLTPYTYSENPPSTAGSDSSNRLTLGSPTIRTDLGIIPLHGAVQQHYIWKRALAQYEHADAMKGNPSLTGMVLGCNMGDDPEVDISGNGGSGAVTGTTLVQGHN